jgi:hypothetical protein
MILCHRSPRRNRLAILRWGLIPRRTSDHNYPNMVGQPEGVYVIPLRRGDEMPWYCSNWPYEIIDAYRIDADGLETIPDPELDWCGGLVILERVLPERIELLPEHTLVR